MWMVHCQTLELMCGLLSRNAARSPAGGRCQDEYASGSFKKGFENAAVTFGFPLTCRPLWKTRSTKSASTRAASRTDAAIADACTTPNEYRRKKPHGSRLVRCRPRLSTLNSD